MQGCSRSSCRRGLWTTPASAGAKCPGTACALRDSQAAAPISELGTDAGAASEWVAGGLVAPIAPIPPLPKTEASQDHLLPALAPCLGRFSSDSSPSRRLRCCVLCSRCLPRPGCAAGLGRRSQHLCLSPRSSLCCLQRSLGGGNVGGEAPHGTQALAGQSQEGWRGGQGGPGCGRQNGKSGLCSRHGGVPPVLLRVCPPC